MLGTEIATETIGAAWLAVARTILDAGAASVYDGAAILEIERVTLTVSQPASSDPIVTELGDLERLAWMDSNFTEYELVAELGHARSYASRLYDYAATGRNFGAKGYGNLAEIAHLMERAAAGLDLEVGRLDFLVKSAHIYEPDFALMRRAVTFPGPVAGALPVPD